MPGFCQGSRELKNLVEQCSSSCVQRRLRSEKSRGSLSVVEGRNQTGAVGAVDPHAFDDVPELWKKLQMAQEELEFMCTGLVLLTTVAVLVGQYWELCQRTLFFMSSY